MMSLVHGEQATRNALASLTQLHLGVTPATGQIVIDGELSDAGWQGTEGVTTWYETNVGDNVEPQVKNEGYLAYDDHYLYAGFRFADPNPALIRAPLAD